MFYIEENNKIVLFNEEREKLVNTLSFMPQYQGLEVKETDRPIVDFQFADTEEFINKQVQKEQEAKILEIKQSLATLDQQSIRSIRAILSGEGTEEDTKFLSQLELQAKELRKGLSNGTEQ